MEAAIRTFGLTRDFPSVRAVDGLSLHVPRGSVYGFLGPNGAGKTTTMHLLLGLIRPTAGSSEVFGLNPALHGAEVRRRCGVLLEHPGLYEKMSAEDNLELHGRIVGMGAADRRARTREILDALGLWDRRGDKVGKWSKGMKQKLAIARVLVHRPELAFLDEPTNGLDPPSAVELRETLVRLARDEGLTVILATHNLSEAERTCSRVAVVHRGRLMAEGSPTDLAGGAGRVVVEGSGLSTKVQAAVKAVPGVLECRLDGGAGLVVDLAPGARSASVVSAIVKAGGEVDGVRRERAGLEEVFLSLTREAQP